MLVPLVSYFQEYIMDMITVVWMLVRFDHLLPCNTWPSLDNYSSGYQYQVQQSNPSLRYHFFLLNNPCNLACINILLLFWLSCYNLFKLWLLIFLGSFSRLHTWPWLCMQLRQLKGHKEKFRNYSGLNNLYCYRILLVISHLAKCSLNYANIDHCVIPTGIYLGPIESACFLASKLNAMGRETFR